ncbi:MAG: carboxypeptidase regulatory-like domain-containing protein [Pedobacter sp.]|nr:MAG: carboxypeptidase regulatory-like domain-containing protein [Pedobacter sp.]
MKYCFLTFLLASLCHMSNAQRVFGLIFHQGRGEPMAQADVVFISESGKEFRTGTDKDGNFFFKKLRKGLYNVKVSGFAIADTILSGIAVNGDTSLTINYNVYCQYDRSAKNKNCPLCGREDSVVRIRYGLIGVRVPKEGHHNSGSQNQKEPDYFPGGCLITTCDPNWYCRRDGLQF